VRASPQDEYRQVIPIEEHRHLFADQGIEANVRGRVREIFGLSPRLGFG